MRARVGKVTAVGAAAYGRCVPLPRSSPAAQGVDSAGLLDLLDRAERPDHHDGLGLHSLMVLRHGHVVAEGWWAPYAAARPHLAYSLSKTFTATAVGLLVGEGLLDLDDPVLARLPAHAHAPSWEEVRLRHCLSMTVGHDTEAWPRVRPLDGDLLPGVLALPLDHPPGVHFAYNQVATYLLARAVRHTTGQELSAVLATRLLGPLGLPTPPWHRDRQGHELGFSGAHVTTETIACLAQLHLDGGQWEGRQLLDPAWVAEATRGFGPLNTEPDAGPDWRRGYGYSFWQQRHGYRGDGAFGQFLVVLPEHDAVVATTAENDRMQETLDALWTHLVPALGGRTSPERDRELARRLARARIPALGGGRGDDVTAPVSGTGRLAVAGYDRVQLRGDALVLHGRSGAHALEVGDGAWRETTLVSGARTLPVAASGGWVGAGHYRAAVLLAETPHRFTVDLRRTADGWAADLQWRLVPLQGADPWRTAVRRA